MSKDQERFISALRNIGYTRGRLRLLAVAASLLLLSCAPQTFITESFPGCFVGENLIARNERNGNGDMLVKDTLEMGVTLETYGTRTLIADNGILDLYRKRFKKGDGVNLTYTRGISTTSFLERQRRSEAEIELIRTEVREQASINLSEALNNRVRLRLIQKGGCIAG